MQPKISIIIPVYNVEKYLRQCLDSVVNQTLQDIQIICVNDGSTDGSLAILQEYADKDSRIEIIDKPNGGNPGGARNAGIPRVRGKYMYFLDSDDWIDPTLCEKTYYRLESTGADLVLFFEQRIVEDGQKKRFHASGIYQNSISPKAEDCFRFFPAPWNRVIQTSFFHKLGTLFPEACLPEDTYLHWVMLANEPKVEVLLEKLHYYRLHDGSQIGQYGEYVAKHGQMYSLVKKYLQHIGKYEQYRTRLLQNKFGTFLSFYPDIRKSIQPDAIRWFRESLDDEEMDFLRNSKEISLTKRAKILSLLGDKLPVKYKLASIFESINRLVLRPFIVKPIERLVKNLHMQCKFEQRIQELNEQLALRDKTIVELRNQQEVSKRRIA